MSPETGSSSGTPDQVTTGGGGVIPRNNIWLYGDMFGFSWGADGRQSPTMTKVNPSGQPSPEAAVAIQQLKQRQHQQQHHLGSGEYRATDTAAMGTPVNNDWSGNYQAEHVDGYDGQHSQAYAGQNVMNPAETEYGDLHTQNYIPHYDTGFQAHAHAGGGLYDAQAGQDGQDGHHTTQIGTGYHPPGYNIYAAQDPNSPAFTPMYPGSHPEFGSPVAHQRVVGGSGSGGSGGSGGDGSNTPVPSIEVDEPETPPSSLTSDQQQQDSNEDADGEYDYDDDVSGKEEEEEGGEEADEDEDDDDDEDGEQRHPKMASRGKARAPKRLQNSAPRTDRHKQRLLSTRPPTHPARATPATKRLFRCDNCRGRSRANFDTAALLAAHIADKHTGPYQCIFSWAGCASRFGSRNEWKRHIATQHLAMQYWACTADQCSTIQNVAPLPSGAIFNRKDLLAQHIRRVHCPPEVRGAKGKWPEWEDRVAFLLAHGERTRCNFPPFLRCPADGCTATFHGLRMWDRRIDHISHHVEQDGEEGAAPIQYGSIGDAELIQWATSPGVAIAEATGAGGYRLRKVLGIRPDGGNQGTKGRVAAAAVHVARDGSDEVEESE